MVDKIQYSNYLGELSCYFDFMFLVLLSDCQQIRKIHNGVKIVGKICFGEDIDVFIRMHKLINNTEYIYCLQNSINNEVKWFSHNR